MLIFGDFVELALAQHNINTEERVCIPLRGNIPLGGNNLFIVMLEEKIDVRILELYTRKVCEMFVYKHTETIE